METVQDCTSTTITIGRSNPDVFLNFRGEDTRNNFVGFLHSFMKIPGIDVFLDSEKLWIGEAIGPACLRAIDQSKISIPIFSQRYPESKWCLLELAQIHKCHISNGQLVLPIFFDVEPSHVRNQIGSFEEAFREHERNFEPQIVDSWRKALKVIGNLKGEVVEKNKNQAEIVELVVKRVVDELISSTYLAECRHQVGMSARVVDLLPYLSIACSQDVQFIGICGVRGIGKTAIAKAVYNHIHSRFDKQSFISDVNKTMDRIGLAYMQNRVLKDIFKTDFDIVDHHRGRTQIEQKLRKENVLLVLDGVDSKEQIDGLAGEVSWFGQGSRVIITTTDEHLLNVAKVDKIYWVKELNHEESFRLFSLHAFSSDEPPQEYMQLSHDVVSYSRGIPSTLELLGCYLSVIRNKKEWKITLQKLKAGKASIYRLSSLRKQRKNINIRPVEENPIRRYPLFQRTVGFNNPVTVATRVFTKSLDPNGSTATERLHEVFTTEKEQNKLETNTPKTQAEPSNKSIRFTLKEIKDATKNFDESLKIGKGGFGTVYKGFLEKDSQWVAIKVADQGGKLGERRKEFLNEIKILSKLKHEHLVSLLGLCEENNEMILVYEYMTKGNLRQHLCGSDGLEPLTWKQRLEICIGIARGLHYLHTGPSEMKVIHRDIKTENILLDDNFMAKIADFGISVISDGPDQTLRVKSGVWPDYLKGTPVFIDPAYLKSRTLTVRSDVYSFGVTLLEVVRGEMILMPGMHTFTLRSRTRQLGKGALEDIMQIVTNNVVDSLSNIVEDERLEGKYSPESMDKFKALVFLCIQSKPEFRPTMDVALRVLESTLKVHEAWLKDNPEEKMIEKSLSQDLGVCSNIVDERFGTDNGAS